MLLEEQRYIAEDLERLEQGIADRMGEEPKQVCFPRQVTVPDRAWRAKKKKSTS